MNLREKINEKYKLSIKSKNTDEINALRLVKSAIKDKDIENRTLGVRTEISDQQILNLLQNLIKQRKDSIESFKAASRDDLINIEKKEIAIITKFLPKQLNIEEIKQIIEKYISENNVQSIKEMGRIMNFLKTNHGASIDMSLAGKVAKELLGS